MYEVGGIPPSTPARVVYFYNVLTLTPPMNHPQMKMRDTSWGRNE